MRLLTIIFFLAVVNIHSVCMADEIFPNCMRNDVNEDDMVTFADSIIISDYINGRLLSCDQILHADVNRDRLISNADFMQLRSELISPGIDDYYTWGDIDGDGRFTATDLGILRDYVTGIKPTLPVLGYDTGDISGDGTVNLLDLDVFETCVDDLLVSPFNASPY